MNIFHLTFKQKIADFGCLFKKIVKDNPLSRNKSRKSKKERINFHKWGLKNLYKFAGSSMLWKLWLFEI